MTVTSQHEELALRYRLARQAQVRWAALSVAERLSRLSRLTTTLLDEMDNIAAVVMEENGKPETEAIGHEVGASLNNIGFLVKQGEELLKSEVRAVPYMLHRRFRVDHLPHGVVLVISPWNIPLSIPLGQVTAALAAGNAVILKPSEVTPRVGALVASLLEPCGLPENLLQVIQGDGKVGAALIELRPDKVCFTGSLNTGKRVMSACSAHPIPVDLELGGVDAMVVLSDADLDYASSAAVWGGTFNGGQVCASVERILVHESISEAFESRVVEKLQQLSHEADLGPITMERQGNVYASHIKDAKERGLKIACGGEFLPHNRFAPTLISGAGVEQSLVYNDESFGPLIALTTFKSDDEAVQKHNNSPFGLTASVFSADVGRAQRLAERLRVGLVSVNDVAATLHAFAELPWGGVGHSGFGRSHGAEGLLAMTRTRVLDLPVPGVPPFKRPWWYPYDAYQLKVVRAFTRLVGSQQLRKKASEVRKMGFSLLRSLRHNPRL